ncbi:MAG: nitrophenyl compound nitroreductase subunit ArsF family protein [Elusimicrobia bacterium]|nr:nitrophenyl compound nitroreductase subunit ArsF family protein [Elusimicrobiota bacterium]
MKRWFGGLLLAFAALSAVVAVYQERRRAPPAPAAPAEAAVETAPARAPKKVERPVVIARYCRGQARCSNCLKIEQYSREAIETGLRQALDSGRLRFEVVNVEEPAHRHYLQDYGLYTKSLVLVAQRGGKEVRYKVLNGVWDHLNDKNAFLAYVREETESFLKQP